MVSMVDPAENSVIPITTDHANLNTLSYSFFHNNGAIHRGYSITTNTWKYMIIELNLKLQKQIKHQMQQKNEV